MQDEILKHTKKIYKTAKDPKHTFREKINEIIIEIFIIVFAVTLSIWLHSWSEHRHQQNETNEFLTDLKEDFKSDIESISISKEKLTINFENCKFALGLTQTKIDSLKNVHGIVEFNSTITTTKINCGNYEGFKSSGKIGYIENKKLKKQILKYYQEQAPGLLEVEKYGTLTFEKVLNFVLEHSEKGIDKIIMMPRFKQLLKLHTDQTNGLIDGYSKTMKDAKEIINEIDKSEK